MKRLILLVMLLVGCVPVPKTPEGWPPHHVVVKARYTGTGCPEIVEFDWGGDGFSRYQTDRCGLEYFITGHTYSSSGRRTVTITYYENDKVVAHDTLIVQAS